MEQGGFYDICGIVASVCMVLGYLPQAIQTIRTRNTDGIALPTFLMMAIGAFSFIPQSLPVRTRLRDLLTSLACSKKVS